MKSLEGLVSVIITTFNNAPYLRKCVDSVLAQTYKTLEVIVVDDGSDDDPRSSLTEINDNRFQKVIEISHQGVSTARNVGIQHASGEYIVFIDADDWVEHNHIELLVNGMSRTDCAIIMMQVDMTDKSSINSEMMRLAVEHPVITNNDFNLLFENYLLSSPCNKIYKTRLIKDKNLQFDKSVSYAEDLLFNLEYFRMIESVSLIPLATYHYVKHSGSGTLRFHRNTSYTLSHISTALTELVGPKLTKETQSGLMKHYLWGILNLSHKDSDLRASQIRAELSLILSIPEYRIALSTLSDIGISSKLQLLLRLRNPTFIHFALKYLLP